MPDFDQTFRLLTGHPRMFSWQCRLLRDWFRKGRLPDEIDLPTGLGKTSIMVLWLMALAEQLQEGRKTRLPLRYVHVIGDRAVVDQASMEAGRIARNFGLQPGLEWMRRALGVGREGIAVSILHGGLTGSSRWLADPARPAIIVGKAEDMVSRLLFDGAGLSSRMRSVHASMLGVDSLMVVDEIRLVPRFVRLARRLLVDGADSLWPSVQGIRPPRFLPMSASGCGGRSVFRLEASDLADGGVARRLEAVRNLRVERTGAGDGTGAVLASRLADAAWRLVRGGGGNGRAVRTIVFCDDENLARQVHATLKERQGPMRNADILLLAGSRRMLEHHAFAETLERCGLLPAGAGAPEKPVVLVAASTIAESMDLDADCMVCDVVSLDRMLLRFGRLSRRAETATGQAVVVVDGMMIARRPAAQAERLGNVVKLLECLGEDASSAAFMRSRAREVELFERGMPPDPYPSSTGVVFPEPGRSFFPSPDQCGPDEADACEAPASGAEILWRAHLPWRHGAPQPEEADVAGYLVAAAPHPLEGLKADASAIASLLIRRAETVLCGSEAHAESAADRGKPVGVLLLSPEGEFEEAFTTYRLAKMTVAELGARIEGRTVLCSARLGGLDAEGQLDPSRDGPVSAVDAGWPEEWRQCLGFRIRRVAGEGLCRLAQEWNRFFVMDLGWKDGEGGDFLVVDVRRERKGDDEDARGGRRSERKRLPLTAAEVAHLAETLGLPDRAARALELAGAWLDLGRAHSLWRRAFSAMPEGHVRSGRNRAGFRDGWGSLFDLMEQIMPTDLDEEIRDLVHHLIGRHAGAVPLESADEEADSAMPEEGGAGRVRLARLARLENRYGRWGLVWLETLLWVAECRVTSEENPPCWHDGCVDGVPDVRRRPT